MNLLSPKKLGQTFKNILSPHLKECLWQRFKYNPLKSQRSENEQKEKLKKPLRVFKSTQRGMALLLAMTSLLLMVYVATEVSKDSALEYVVNAQDINRIKAYYAARNGLELALLRVKIYQQAARANLPPQFASQLNLIWSFPLSWPLPLPPEMLEAQKDEFGDAAKDALFKDSFSHTILDEGSKIDINDLASPSKSLREVTQQQILNIFESELNTNDRFKDEYANFNFKELVNRIADWMSDKNTSANGGDKRQSFRDLGPGYPPNRGFRTLDELRLIPGMNETLFNLLKPSITIYGSKAINPNTATLGILKSLDPGLTEEALKEAMEYRDNEDLGGPFKGASASECRNDFKKFVEARGARLGPEFEKIPFQCDKVTNFKIISIGEIGSGKNAVKKKITIYVLDIAKAASVVKSQLEQEKKDAQNQNSNGENSQDQNNSSSQNNAGQKPQDSSSQKQEPLPKGQPRIVYWTEE